MSIIQEPTQEASSDTGYQDTSPVSFRVIASDLKKVLKSFLFSQKIKKKNKRRRPCGEEEEQDDQPDYWAVYYLYDSAQVVVTFIPYGDLAIDLDGNIWDQTRDQVESLYEKSSYDMYVHYDLLENAKEVAMMFVNYECIPITYGPN